jgi:hypothetical protein
LLEHFEGGLAAIGARGFETVPLEPAAEQFAIVIEVVDDKKLGGPHRPGRRVAVLQCPIEKG